MDIHLLERLGAVAWGSVERAADLGCGTGRTGAWLRERGVAAIDGVDLTPEMLDVARAREVYATLVEADVSDTGLASGAYDLVVTCLVDEHLADLRPLYAEARRLARPGGVYVLVGFHPHFIMASGMPTHYDSASGEAVAIQTYVHLLSDHVSAGLAAGWTLVEMRERVIDDAWLELKPKWASLRDQPIAFAVAWRAPDVLEATGAAPKLDGRGARLHDPPLDPRAPRARGRRRARRRAGHAARARARARGGPGRRRAAAVDRAAAGRGPRRARAPRRARRAPALPRRPSRPRARGRPPARAPPRRRAARPGRRAAGRRSSAGTGARRARRSRPRLDEAVAALGARYTKLTIREQRTRWGSCSTTGAMSFNWRLLLGPEDVLDYVVWHEACHLVVMDHSRRFWSLLARHRPRLPRAAALAARQRHRARAARLSDGPPLRARARRRRCDRGRLRRDGEGPRRRDHRRPAAKRRPAGRAHGPSRSSAASAAARASRTGRCRRRRCATRRACGSCSRPATAPTRAAGIPCSTCCTGPTRTTGHGRGTATRRRSPLTPR